MKNVTVPFRFLYMIISVLFVEICIFLPLYLVGLVVMAWASKYAALTTQPSMLYPKTTVHAFRSKFLNAWLGNYEDGLFPLWWEKQNPSYSMPKMIYTWFLRNPVCNMRFWPIISTKPDASKVGYVGADKSQPDGIPCWYFAWQGLYAGFRYQTKTRNFWFGYKVKPEDRFGLPIDSYRNWGIGIAMQFNKADV